MEAAFETIKRKQHIPFNLKHKRYVGHWKPTAEERSSGAVAHGVWQECNFHSYSHLNGYRELKKKCYTVDCWWGGVHDINVGIKWDTGFEVKSVYGYVKWEKSRNVGWSIYFNDNVQGQKNDIIKVYHHTYFSKTMSQMAYFFLLKRIQNRLILWFVLKSIQLYTNLENCRGYGIWKKKEKGIW